MSIEKMMSFVFTSPPHDPPRRMRTIVGRVVGLVVARVELAIAATSIAAGFVAAGCVALCGAGGFAPSG